MKRFLFWSFTLLLLAAAAHIVSAVLLPRMKMNDMMEALLSAGKTNSLTLIEHQKVKQKIFENSPEELALAICPYDIQDKPISISISLPDTYWSISIFGPEGQNIYTINDRQVGKDQFSALIMRQQDTVDQSEDSSNRKGDGIIVRSEFNTGVVVMRTYIADRASKKRAQEVLANAECKPALTTASVN